MLRFIVNRILMMIPVIIFVSFLVFGLMELAPGNVAQTALEGAGSAEERELVIRQYDLDRSVLYRYGMYMLNLVRGDMGVGQLNRIPVWDAFIKRLPYTLMLSFTAITIASLIAIPTGIFAARRAGTLADNFASVLTLLFMSMPNFWMGIVLILVFAQSLGWFPTGGTGSFSHLVLPAITSSAILMGTATRQTRSSMLEVLKADYLRTARAKGVPENVVIRKHALGNAWIPILTVIGTSLIISFVGAMVVETVFSWPGIGRMAYTAVRERDVTTITGVVIMAAIMCMLVQLVIDLLYALVDPRIKAKFFKTGKKRRTA